MREWCKVNRIYSLKKICFSVRIFFRWAELKIFYHFLGNICIRLETRMRTYVIICMDLFKRFWNHFTYSKSFLLSVNFYRNNFPFSFTGTHYFYNDLLDFRDEGKTNFQIFFIDIFSNDINTSSLPETLL